MGKQVTLLGILFFAFSVKTTAGILLTATTFAASKNIQLQWNMPDYAGNTGYTLYKSTDGVTWLPAAANHVFRAYTSATLLAYNDIFSGVQKLLYKVKVYDENENIIAVSNTAEVTEPVNNFIKQSSSSPVNNDAKPLPGKSYGASWQIYPNPVADILILYYKGSNAVKGVINAVIQDATGKVFKRFRAASNNKQLSIDVSNLQAGLYFIRINVSDEVQMNEKFMKK